MELINAKLDGMYLGWSFKKKLFLYWSYIDDENHRRT